MKEVPPPPNTRMFDYHYRARYKIHQHICGDEVGNEIEFDVYDHQGSPKFAEKESVLLYVSRYMKGYVHQKYVYNAVYRATDGSWAGCGDPYLFARTPRGTIETTRLELVEPVTISVVERPEDYIAEHYSAEYYVRDGDSMTCRTGAPAEQVYAIERLGVLKAREELERL